MQRTKKLAPPDRRGSAAPQEPPAGGIVPFRARVEAPEISSADLERMLNVLWARLPLREKARLLLDASEI